LHSAASFENWSLHYLNVNIYSSAFHAGLEKWTVSYGVLYFTSFRPDVCISTLSGLFSLNSFSAVDVFFSKLYYLK
jgi:hypothetical protein